MAETADPVQIAVIAIFLCLGLLLAVPVNVVFHLQHRNTLQVRVAVFWLFGWVQWRFRTAAASQGTHALRNHSDRPRPFLWRVRSAGRASLPSVLTLLRQPGIGKRVYRLATDLITAAHLHPLHLRLRVGLDDPADTGYLWALMGPMNAWVQNFPHATVRIEPEFMAEVFELDARGRARGIPLRFLGLGLEFVLSFVGRRAWRKVREWQTQRPSG